MFQLPARVLAVAIALLVAIATVISLPGCGGSSSTATAAAPTTITDFSVAAIVGGGYTSIVPDEFNIVRLPEGVEVYFWVGGPAYEVHPMGGFGAIGGAMGGGTITGSFLVRNEDGEGNHPPSYSPAVIPFTQGANMYRMYHPPTGDYLVTASFPFEGKSATTAPLHFTVGPYSTPQ